MNSNSLCLLLNFECHWAKRTKSCACACQRMRICVERDSKGEKLDDGEKLGGMTKLDSDQVGEASGVVEGTSMRMDAGIGESGVSGSGMEW